MSMQTNPEEEVATLLKRLELVLQNINIDQGPLNENINQIEQDLNNIKHLFLQVQNWEQNLFDQLKGFDCRLRNFDSGNIEVMLDYIDSDINQIKNTVSRPPKVLVSYVMILEKDLPSWLKSLRHNILTIGVEEDDPFVKKISKIEDDCKNIEALFPAVKQWEQKLLDQCTDLERYLRNFDRPNIQSMLDGISAEFNKIKNSLSLQLKGIACSASEQELQKDKGKGAIVDGDLEKEVSGPMDVAKEFLQVSSYYDSDRLQLRLCLVFSSIFPENAVIRKRPLIYWWVGEGLIPSEDVGEEIFDNLLELNLIRPYGNGKNPVVNKCQIHPSIYEMLSSSASNALLFDFDSSEIPLSDNTSSRPAKLVWGHRPFSPQKASKPADASMIFNLDERYVGFKSKWLAKLKNLVVLQLGRWQGSSTHHIQVVRSTFLRDLRAQKRLKYLSLRGIFGITKLPTSIVELVSLEILDLKACYNLETLPPDIAPLTKLTHLDLSECYLLTSMPQGLGNLASLQVLKGYVIGSGIDDLTELTKLKRLSVCIVDETIIKDGDFDKLRQLKLLRCLKITWDVRSEERRQQIVKQSFSFPPSLEKLVLEGTPQEHVQWLQPSQLSHLKKLYIRGGKLERWDYKNEWKNVEILILKYLEKLEIELPILLQQFPSLRYLRYGMQRQDQEMEQNGTKDIEWCKED